MLLHAGTTHKKTADQKFLKYRKNAHQKIFRNIQLAEGSLVSWHVFFFFGEWGTYFGCRIFRNRRKQTWNVSCVRCRPYICGLFLRATFDFGQMFSSSVVLEILLFLKYRLFEKTLSWSCTLHACFPWSQPRISLQFRFRHQFLSWPLATQHSTSLHYMTMDREALKALVSRANMHVCKCQSTLICSHYDSAATKRMKTKSSIIKDITIKATSPHDL